MQDRVMRVDADIWLSDVLDNLTNDELDAECRARSMSNATREAVLDALIMLKTGRIEDGIAALEREFFPRYADEAECAAAYRRAMVAEEGRVVA